MKTSGFNFPNLEEDNKKIDSMFGIGESLDMLNEKPKKKKKWNFDKLFPAPKHNENMGMDTLYDGKPFEGLLG